jgi:hypothetical protein
MNDPTRHALLQVLGNEMSDISEDGYCAGWLGSTEHFVPELCRRAIESGIAQKWGACEVTPERARGLIALAEQIGSWVNLDEQAVGYVPFQPFPIPQHLADVIEREQSK